jgi:hypothetical protein
VNIRLKTSDVFINCPFDRGYRPIFNAIVFSVYDLGFIARCALEEDDAGDFRLSKIERMIEECRFGINDLSSVALDATTGLPRFKMPLELGLFLGCKRFGSPNQSKKRTLVLDSDPYRYRGFISDIAGQDSALTEETRSAPSAKFATGSVLHPSEPPCPAEKKSSTTTTAFKAICRKSAQSSHSNPIG